nr:DUF5680 domain-containing protein [Paenactinomyces guangxiensis]
MEAKIHTYASQGDGASVQPLLPGSKQLEYSKSKFLYRDVYYGFVYFAGQETVYFEGSPLWSMSYAGGVSRSLSSTQAVRDIYSFLRTALRKVSPERPYRGPKQLINEKYAYYDENIGDLGDFWGFEYIKQNESKVYELRYQGGFIR